MGKDDLEEKEDLEEILEEAEILAELKEEEKIRKKNAKIIGMAVAGILICGGVYFFSQQTPPPSEIHSTKPPPPREEEVFPEAGKIKVPNQPMKEMKPVEEPLVSNEDTLPVPKEKAETVKPLVKPVEIQKEKAEKKAEETEKTYKIRVGPFVLADELKQAMKEVRSLGLEPLAKKENNRVYMHKVLVGPYENKIKASEVKNRLQAKKIKGFVMQTEGKYYVSAGAFYKQDGALKIKEKLDKLALPSRPLYQPVQLKTNTLYATKKGTLSEAEKILGMLKKKGFKDAKMIRN